MSGSLKLKKIVFTVLCMTMFVWGFFAIKRLQLYSTIQLVEGTNFDGNKYLQNLTKALTKRHDIHTIMKNLTHAFNGSDRRSNVSIVLGIPTVKRDHPSYLHTTLRSIFQNMGEDEESDTLVIILIAETELHLVTEIENGIKVEFSHQLESGIVELISPSLDYYPDWSNLKQTLGKF